MANQSRRRFLTTSALAASAGGAACIAQGSEPDGGRQYYEWRTYRIGDALQQALVLGHLESAAAPAWKRLGIGPVGAFTETGDAASLDVHVLLTFASSDEFLRERTGLEADSDYVQSAKSYLAAAKNDPAFARIDSTLMVAFAAQPQLRAPRRRPRVLELRTYQSHSESKARKKIEMFNDGEIPIFRDAGFATVLFGESLFGADLPHLKYLLASDDMAANKASWAAFIDDPNWKAMKDLPKYADTVSHIDKVFLKPTGFSDM
ncbi:MAG: NIPSNAP family protein [Aeoliella sp.]